MPSEPPMHRSVVQSSRPARQAGVSRRAGCFGLLMGLAPAWAWATGPDAAAEPRRLRGTYWKLVRLKGQPVRFDESRPEAHLLLDAGELRASGSGGCNRFNGGFRVAGQELRLVRLASTEMACREGLQQEADYLASLAQVAGYRVQGQRLSLLDAQGRVLLEFEAVDLR